MFVAVIIAGPCAIPSAVCIAHNQTSLLGKHRTAVDPVVPCVPSPHRQGRVGQVRVGDDQQA